MSQDLDHREEPAVQRSERRVLLGRNKRREAGAGMRDARSKGGQCGKSRASDRVCQRSCRETGGQASRNGFPGEAGAMWEGAEQVT